MKKLLRFVQSFVELYNGKRLTRASAAMSYYLTLTFFPLIICLYTMLGDSYDAAMRVLRFAENLMAAETVGVLEDFLLYVANNNSKAMMMAAIAVLVSSASAAMRTLQGTVGELQGEQRYDGLLEFMFSIVFSLLFVAALYFSIVVMLTGRSFINKLNEWLPFIDISSSWNSLRFLIMAGIEFVIILGLYEACRSRRNRYKIWPGAIVASVLMVGVSIAYSAVISASAKYSLVYGSLAAVVLLMLWLHTCCQVIYCGAAFNIVLRDLKRKE